MRNSAAAARKTDSSLSAMLASDCSRTGVRFESIPLRPKEAVPTSIIAGRKDAAVRAVRLTAEIMEHLTTQEGGRGKPNGNCEGALAENCERPTSALLIQDRQSRFAYVGDD